MPLASTILMIRPAAFGFNEETEEDNFFQFNTNIGNHDLQHKAEGEFDNMVEKLMHYGISVIVINDTKEPAKPDAIFPNNWLSTSPDGVVSVFSMFAPNRRAEKRDDILKKLKEQFVVKNIQNLSEFEKEGRFLEGTGSMVIDHENKMIYASISERTNMPVLEKFVSANGYQAIVFIATDKNGRHIYHTNIMMSIGENFAVLCEESIDEEWELIAVRQLLESTGHTIIPITREQMHCFAGNMLQLQNNKGDKFLVLSQTAFNSLRKEQKQMLEAYSQLMPIDIPIIEKVGGGSVRCMMAEVFLKKRN
ncbi:MAG: amidinotransferase [Bacteroidia bacterium]|nr:amidinotransferase [Bacteroidia bacterium]